MRTLVPAPSNDTQAAVTFRSDGCVAIHVPDLARAEAFYGRVLGFRLVEKTASQLVFDTGALRLYVNRDADAPMPFIPALEVRDYAAAKAYLQRAGCEIVREWPGGHALYFRDPFGFVLDIVERRARREGGSQETCARGTSR